MSDRAERMRREFDREFALPVRADVDVRTELLAIRVGAQPYAVPRGDVAGLHVDRQIARLPGAAPGLLGLSAFRGTHLPIYDLRVLLGSGREGAAPRWAIVAAAAPVAFAFDALDAHVRVEADAIVAAADGGARRVARLVDGPRPLLELAPLVEALRARIK